MGHKHTREDILAGALEAAVDDGLSQLTFGRLAKRLGIDDRIVVYYFPTKHDLLTAVLLALGGRLQDTLAGALTAPAADHLELARAAWPVLARSDADPTFGLFFEAIGLAAVGRAPYTALGAPLFEAWASWLEGFLSGPAAERRDDALAAMALLDGLLLLRQISGPAAADRAAARLGVR